MNFRSFGILRCRSEREKEDERIAQRGRSLLLNPNILGGAQVLLSLIEMEHTIVMHVVSISFSIGQYNVQ